MNFLAREFFKFQIMWNFSFFFVLQLLFARESFEKTKAEEKYVIAGWKPKVEAAWIYPTTSSSRLWSNPSPKGPLVSRQKERE